MKNFIALLIIVFFILISNQIYAQGYFISSSGSYLSPEKFETNIQSDLPKYEGTYTAVSETYESAYTYIVIYNSKSIDILLVNAAFMDGENWTQDTTIISDVQVREGMSKVDNSNIGLGSFGNTNFRFVKVTYKLDGKTIKADGLVMEEYFMFAEKEK